MRPETCPPEKFCGVRVATIAPARAACVAEEGDAAGDVAQAQSADDNKTARDRAVMTVLA
jgi:hypothetical protein